MCLQPPGLAQVAAGELGAEPRQPPQTHITSGTKRLGPQPSPWLIVTRAARDTSPNQQARCLTWEQRLITAQSFWLLFRFP